MSYVLPEFTQCSGDPVTLSLKYKNGTALPTVASPWIKFVPTTGTLYIAPSTNALVGIYTLRLTAVVTASTSYTNFTDFDIEIVANKVPLPKLTFLTPVSIFAHHDFSWTVLFDKDLEEDIPSFSAEVVDNSYASINSTSSYFYVDSSDDTGIVFSVINPP